MKIKWNSRPRDSQSAFEITPKSLIPTPPLAKWTNRKAASSSRCEVLHDELSTFKFDSELVVQSKQFCENSGIPKFSLKVKQDFTYNAYHTEVKWQISALTKNCITLCNRWSTIEKILRFLNSLEIDKKKDVLMQQIDAISRLNSIHK